MFSELVIGKSSLNEKKYLLLDSLDDSDKVRVAILPLTEGSHQQVVYISTEEFTEICKNWLEAQNEL